MTIPTSEAYAELQKPEKTYTRNDASWTPKPERNNRRPYKADIRRVAEVELARAADEIVRLREYHQAYKEGALESYAEMVRTAAKAIRAQRNRWRIACLALAVVAVAGWLT